MLLFRPSRPDPCCFLVAVVAFLFFSPGAGETQTREWFVFPLVSLRPGHAHRLRPVLLHLQLPLGHRPRLFFFSSFRRWWSVLAVVGLSLSLSLFAVLLHCMYTRIA